MVSNDNNNLIDMYWGQFDLLFVKQTEREKKENKESLLSREKQGTPWTILGESSKLEE